MRRNLRALRAFRVSWPSAIAQVDVIDRSAAKEYTDEYSNEVGARIQQ